MSAERTNKDDIFNAAAEITDSTQRLAFLDEACGDDLHLRKEIDELLEQDLEVGSFLESPPPGLTIDHPFIEQPGTQIGPYKLLQKIGEGGMGVVYMAEQKQPMKRRVALKIIKPGMDTRQVIARFEAERQALAMMDHPSIAKVLDAGQTESGRPYFVMELVNGISVTKYCDQQHLTPKERLQLFVNLCQAVQHAHQKGIIHRDLKPSNVLVALYDGKAVPKVIDFGVAKATNQSLTEKTMFTQIGQIVGTLEYMSPEQAERNQLDVDTRSDIYSLGVILYELLSGETPFDSKKLRSAAFEEMLRIIREDEPSKPSTKVSSSDALPSIAANRRIAPQKLGATIRGELDWIVMKAMEKDRGRRYETASKFAEDVEHYLNDEAVTACPPSKAYRFRKFARRNKAVIGTMATIAASLIAGIIGTSWQAYRATIAERDAFEFAADASSQANRADQEAKLAREAEAKAINEAQRADQEAAIAIAVREFLEDDLLGLAGATAQIDAELSPDPNIKLRTIVDRAAEGIEDRFVDQPAIKAAICLVIGKVYYSLGEYQQAEKFATRSAELGAAVWESDDERILLAEWAVANAKDSQGYSREAETVFRRLLPIIQRQYGANNEITCSYVSALAVSLSTQGKYREAEQLFRETLEIRRRILGPEDPDTLNSMLNLAGTLYSLGQAKEAEKIGRETLEIRQRVSGPEHPHTLKSMNNLALYLSDQGQYQEAEKLHRETLEIQRRVLGPEHPDTLNSMNNLAISLSTQGKYREAEKLSRETLEISQRVLGPENPHTLRASRGLADSLRNQSQFEEAEKLYRETLEIKRRILGPEHSEVLNMTISLSVCLGGQREYQEAEQLQRKTLQIQRRVLGPEHRDTLLSMINLANSLGTLRQVKEAEILNRETLEVSQRVLGPDHPDTLRCMYNLAFYLSDQEAEILIRETLETSQRVLGPEHPDTLRRMFGVANSLARQRKYQEAEKLYRETLEIQRRVLGRKNPETLRTITNLGFCLNKQRKFHEAEKLNRETLESRRRVLGLTHPDTLNSTNGLGVSLLQQSKYQEAEKFFRDTLELYRKTVGADHSSTLGCLSNLVIVLNYQEKFAEVESLLHQSFKSLERTAGADDPRTSMIRSKLVTFLTNRSWHLATASDSNKRDPEEAVRTATLAAELSPDSANNWNNVGVAQYRLGEFDAALEAFKKADGMIEGGDREHRMFLAMTLWQLDRQEDALAKYVEGAAWIVTNKENNGEQIRFRSEAETMMKIDSERREELIAKDDSDPSQRSAKPQMTQNIPTKEDTDK